MKIKINYILVITIVIASLLRIYNLSTVPPHLTPDEAALGYNAYSILKTGRDEYGKAMPLIFKSFGDYKPGLYIYLTVPFIILFDLNEYSVRLPSALSGIVAVLFLYLITYELFKDKKIAVFSAILLAINPWHILLSRGAWEVNVSLTLTLIGIFAFLKGIKRPLYLIISASAFSLTFLCYQGAKLSTGIVILLLGLIFIKEIKKISINKFVMPVLVAIIISLPAFLSFFQGETGRLKVFSVFSYPRPTQYLQDFLDQGNENVGDISYLLFHSEKLNFLRGILGRFFNHFSMRFLFIEGDWQNPRHSAVYQGMFILLDLIPMVFGLYFLLSQKLNKNNIFILLWLLIAPLPSILSRDQVHAVRGFNLVIPLVIMSSLGLAFMSKNFNRFLVLIFVVLYSVNYIYFIDSYFIHVPSHNSKLWEYGYKQIVEAVTPIQKNYREVRVQQSYAQPYIFFLFYQKYDPLKYQEKAYLAIGENSQDVGKVEHLDNIYFGPIDWSINRGSTDTLFVGDTVRIPVHDSSDPEHFNLIKEIKYLNGETAFRIIEVKK